GFARGIVRALHVGLPLRTVVSCRGNPLWLPLRYWCIDKYQKIYASVLIRALYLFWGNYFLAYPNINHTGVKI
ncbi:MAG: hypothetical protein B6247_31450, partial [Candidatus Parabeggiatoa sp. nov. 2]